MDWVFIAQVVSGVTCTVSGIVANLLKRHYEIGLPQCARLFFAGILTVSGGIGCAFAVDARAAIPSVSLRTALFFGGFIMTLYALDQILGIFRKEILL